jgi:hypothetical protein
MMSVYVLTYQGGISAYLLTSVVAPHLKYGLLRAALEVSQSCTFRTRLPWYGFSGAISGNLKIGLAVDQHENVPSNEWTRQQSAKQQNHNGLGQEHQRCPI